MNDISTTPVSVESLPVITWSQAKVITTELLARLYGTETDNIRQNFSSNVSKFQEGKHFFKLEGEALRQFKNCVSDPHAVPKHTRNLTLWTERGAARHAKMLDTEAAWEVFEKLEDCYFQVKKILENAPYVANPDDTLTLEQANELRNLVKTECDKLPKDFQAQFNIKVWSKLKSHFGVSYRKIPQAEFTEAISIVARHAASYPQVSKSLALTFEPPLIQGARTVEERMHNRALEIAKGMYFDCIEQMRSERSRRIACGTQIEDWAPRHAHEEVVSQYKFIAEWMEQAQKNIRFDVRRLESIYGKRTRDK